MRYWLMVIVWCLALPTWADDPRIEQIRHTYQEVQQSLKTLKVTAFEPTINSTEGVEALKYMDKQGQLKLIKFTAFGEMGQSIKQYYFKNKQLVFVLATDKDYQVPFYIDSQKAKELGVQPFDPKKVITTERRYYFYQRHLIRMLGVNKESIAASDPSFKQAEQDLLTELAALLKAAQ